MNVLVNLVKLFLTLDGLIWFLIGGFTYIAVSFAKQNLKELKKYKKSIYTLVILTVLTLDFTIFWMYESYLENEIKAANMGLITFGAIAVIFALVAYRLIKKDNTSEAVKVKS